MAVISRYRKNRSLKGRIGSVANARDLNPTTDTGMYFLEHGAYELAFQQGFYSSLQSYSEKFSNASNSTEKGRPHAALQHLVTDSRICFGR